MTQHLQGAAAAREFLLSSDKLVCMSIAFEKLRTAAILVAGVVCLPLILVFLLACVLGSIAWGIVLRIWFWRAHVIRGRSILFVYSDSPNWQTYIEANILPRIQDKAVVLNWSQRRHWSTTCPWERRFFIRFAGSREFNPVAIVFRRHGKINTIRFYQAFKDLKRGDARALEQAECRLFELADSATLKSRQGEPG